jgi:hypothetical protein
MTDAQEEVPFFFASARLNELNIGQPIGEEALNKQGLPLRFPPPSTFLPRR